MYMQNMDVYGAYRNMTDEAKELYRRYKQWCDECPKAYDFTCSGASAERCRQEKRKLLLQMLDITDTRKFCVVTAQKGYPVRHIFPVSADAEEHLEELKTEYYTGYARLPYDEFHFFIGLHRAQAFAEAFAK